MVKVMSQGHQLLQALDLLLAKFSSPQYQYLHSKVFRFQS